MPRILRRLCRYFNSYAALVRGRNGTKQVVPRVVSIPDLPRRIRIRQHDEHEDEYAAQWAEIPHWGFVNGKDKKIR